MEYTTIGQFLSMATATIIAVAAFIAGMLYHKAYLEMKRTKIIGALMWFLYAISAKFAIIVLSFGILWSQGIDLATFNAMQSVPNFIVIWALLNFLYRSVSTPEETKKCLKTVDSKDLRKI
jgi:hypothetical protein